MFPASSSTLYVNLYSPKVVVSTFPSISILFVISPSILSMALAPSSIYSVLRPTINSFVPFIVIVGAILSFTITFLFISSLSTL